MTPPSTNEMIQIRARAKTYRERNDAFAHWANGYGVIKHDDLTQVRIHELVGWLQENGTAKTADEAYECLAAADRVANAAMWLTVHMTYAKHAYTDGRAMQHDDFKPDPQGHTGGALNMAIAYTGYFAANALSGTTRSWMMGQGHCVAAIDAANLILQNMTEEQASRYAYTDEGLSAFVQDFYAYAVDNNGLASSPLGSHVNPHTAGGLIEGGYLGFAELLYPHMPLPGESLVAFLSDGAFEEQRGSDWAARWWRAEDSGLVAPIMIANGRRIDQRTTMTQSGGVKWFRDHLKLNGFSPLDIDGRDPAAFAWAILEMETRLTAAGTACMDGSSQYPVPLPYGIAETEKGFGFPGAGTNNAHNLPLEGNPAKDDDARDIFNDGASKLFVPHQELEAAIQILNNHERNRRTKERDHPLASRKSISPTLPEPDWRATGSAPVSPMEGIDTYFCDLVQHNPSLRPRVGNPDEMRSNQLNRTLDLLKHRVTAPEDGIAESIDGAVVTALNEEAVVCAALGNKGGLNLVCSYEAFAVKMLGALRQDIIFARNQQLAGQSPQWLGLPIVLTSHTWENGKNEQSHQDPTLAEALLGEMSDVSRVVFPCDWNSAQAAMCGVYGSRGTVWTMVVPKRAQPNHLDHAQALQLVRHGAVRLRGNGTEAIVLTATGAYQLTEIMKASDRLAENGVDHAVAYMMEPGRFRVPRDRMEEAALVPEAVRSEIYPDTATIRIFLTHTRPEPYLGTIRPLDTGPLTTHVLGYANRGGTLDANGLLYANGATWAHVLKRLASAVHTDLTSWLSTEEIMAVNGRGSPQTLWD